MDEKGSNVRVAVRIRPAIIEPSINAPIPTTCLQIVPDEPQLVIGRDEAAQKTFTYDYLYSAASTQVLIYNELAAPLVGQFLQGFNATILAYGQTYSGKTYTMGSTNNESTNEEELGILPRVFRDIFNAEMDKGYQHVFKVSFLEIYQEQIRDLLVAEHKEISVREKDGVISLSGVSEEIVSNAEQMRVLLTRGGLVRSTGDTQMHSHSSRSHAIFTITYEKQSVLERSLAFVSSEVENVVVQRSKLHLVDLAGSERLKRTGAEGVRLKESVKINSGLLALGNVVSVLGGERTNENDRPMHVPYRDSKLTRLLQDSLGGNSQTLMLACVSPLQSDYDETLNTLKYAYRARKIENKPIVNIVDQLALERSNMQKKIETLEDKLKHLQGSGAPIQVTPAMIDFDNDQWMQYFMEQLKSRTMRGTNAMKALEKSNKEIDSLKLQIQELQKTVLEHEGNDIKVAYDKLEKEFNDLQTQASGWKNALNVLLQYSLRALRGETPEATLVDRVKEVVGNYFPSETFDVVEEDKPTKPLFLPLINGANSNRAPSTNSMARSTRRKRMESETNDDLALKPLETELRETRKYLTQMEDQLARTKIMLQQTEAISEESSREITRLRDQNEALKERLFTVSGEEGNDRKSEIMSIRVLTDAGVQTSHVDTVNEEEFPVRVPSVDDYSPGSTIEKLTHELSLATKAKVDLLKELSKHNKESERIRHVHLDQVQKLEREVKALERELLKAQQEKDSKETAIERLKEEYERKLRLQEGHLQKAKAKLKDVEKNIKLQVGGRKLQDRQQEIEKLNLQIAALKKKQKEDQEKGIEVENRRSMELTNLSKQLEEETKKCRHLEAKVENFRKKLDRKVEEVQELAKKARDVETNVDAKRRKTFGGKSAKEADENLVGDVEIIHQAISNDVGDVKNSLAAKREALEQLENRLQNEQNEETINQLRAEKSALVTELSELRSDLARMEHSNEASAQEILEKYQEVLEAFRDDESISEMISNLADATLDSCRVYLCECLQVITKDRQELEDLRSQYLSSKEESEERGKAIEYLEKKIQKTIRSYEKKIAALQSQSQEEQREIETQSSEAQTEVVESNSSDLKDLQKDVFYYRNANKELKSKLREVVAVNHRLAKSLKSQSENGDQPQIPAAVE